MDIQVEVGPQDGTLLVTWLPVTITTAGTSNGCLVTGYSVYIDGHRIKDLTSPTGDHVVLGWKDVVDVASDPRQVRVTGIPFEICCSISLNEKLFSANSSQFHSSRFNFTPALIIKSLTVSFSFLFNPQVFSYY